MRSSSSRPGVRVVAEPNPKTVAVFRWLAQTLRAGYNNPAVLLKAKDEIKKNEKVIEGAVRDAIRPEFEEYVELVKSLLGGGSA